MKNYPSLKNLFISIYSVDVGLEESEEKAALDRVLSDHAQRKEIEGELKQLFKDEAISWVELLENDEYVVYPADDEDDAKGYVIDSLWSRIFPNEPAP
ncbi:MAG: hypothetical protein GXP08_14650 [Gammaproteobacteria bacterium]|nr:hypothetical protein [Gammaproteobacteria bacterium]